MIKYARSGLLRLSGAHSDAFAHSFRSHAPTCSDAFVIALAREMPVKTIADLLEVGDDRIWRVLDHYVPAARTLEDFSDVTAVRVRNPGSSGHRFQKYPATQSNFIRPVIPGYSATPVK
jgi:hypothetical protein